MHILTPAHYKVMPWVNGRGVTTEIWREPADGARYDFRISLADVPEDGPFSLFSGYERRIAVAEGGGMELTVDGICSGPIRAADPAFAFSGAALTSARLLDGPIRDFNLIFDPERVTATLTVLSPATPSVEIPQGARAFLYVHDGAASLDGVPITKGHTGLAPATHAKLDDGLAFLVTIA